MKAKFTFDEAVYNSVLMGKKFCHSEDGLEREIAYVKLTKDSRQIKVHCVQRADETEPAVFLANQDDIHECEVNNELQDRPVNKKKSKRRKK